VYKLHYLPVKKSHYPYLSIMGIKVCVGVEQQPHVFLIFNEPNGQLHLLACVSTRNSPWYTLDRSRIGPKSQYVHCNIESISAHYRNFFIFISFNYLHVKKSFTSSKVQDTDYCPLSP
jgi:hypothetical protein